MYWKTFLGGIFTFMGRRLDTIKTALWSEMPGIVSTLLMRVGLLVKKSSIVFAIVSVILVGSVII